MPLLSVSIASKFFATLGNALASSRVHFFHRRLNFGQRDRAALVGVDGVEVLRHPRHRLGFLARQAAVVVLVGRFEACLHAGGVFLRRNGEMGDEKRDCSCERNRQLGCSHMSLHWG